MDLPQKVLNIGDELTDVEKQLSTIEDKIEDAVDEAAEIDPAQTEEERAEFESLNRKIDELEGTKSLVRGYRNSLDEAVQDWDGTEVVFREISGAESRSIKARAQQRADEMGVGYSEDFHETLFLQKATVSTPPGAPDPENIGDLPNRLFEWLHMKANNLNTVGEFDMGNSSLRERLTDRK